MDFTSILKKGGLLEDNKKASAATAPASNSPIPRPAAGFASAVPAYTSPSGVSAITGDNDKAYQRLLNDTDLNQFPDYQTFMSEVKILEEALPGPGNQVSRFNAALTSLTGHGQMSKERLLRVFTDALARLDASVANFNQALEAKRKSDITDREARVDSIKQQIEDLQRQQSELIGQIGQSRVQLEQANASFAGAVSRRKTEIQAEQGSFLATLK